MVSGGFHYHCFSYVPFSAHSSLPGGITPPSLPLRTWHCLFQTAELVNDGPKLKPVSLTSYFFFTVSILFFLKMRISWVWNFSVLSASYLETDFFFFWKLWQILLYWAQRIWLPFLSRSEEWMKLCICFPVCGMDFWCGCKKRSSTWLWNYVKEKWEELLKGTSVYFSLLWRSTWCISEQLVCCGLEITLIIPHLNCFLFGCFFFFF